MHRFPFTFLTAFLIALTAVSCGGDGTATGGGADTGLLKDAGESETDSGGISSDGGAPDSTMSDDTGAHEDTGNVNDTGAPDDAGAPGDSGTDGGMQPDVGIPADAGADTGHDAGTDAGTDAGAAYWTPAPGTSWQIQFSGTLDTTVDVEVYDVDLFDTAQADLDRLKAAGRKVICYFSAGSYEDWRDDAGAFQKADYGKPLDNWPGEWWLDVRSQNVRGIMSARMDLAVQKRCDGVDPDNVDGYQNDTGFALTTADQEGYLRFLAKAAHDRGLAIGLKNCLGLVPKIVSEYQWQINEECLAYSECADLKPFIDGGKAVFHIEYVNATSEGPAKKAEVCGDPTTAGFSTLVKTWGLDAWRIACP